MEEEALEAGPEKVEAVEETCPGPRAGPLPGRGGVAGLHEALAVRCSAGAGLV